MKAFTGLRVSVGLYRLLLYAYPAEFRAEYGGEMLRCFIAMAHDCVRERGSWRGLSGLWCRTIVDLAISAWQQHSELFRRHPMSAMKRFLAARITSEAFDSRFGQCACYAAALAVLVLGFRRLGSTADTPAEAFLGVLLVLTVGLMLVVLGTVTRLLGDKRQPESANR